MMSLIDLDDDQRWVPTHVNVTVLRARGLRTKGKHGSRYLYTIIQVAKDKYTTGLVEKAEVPQWNEECCFELLPGILEEGGRGAYPPGSGDLVLTVMHRVLIGLDVFLGQTIIPLDKIFQDGMCPRDEWFKLNSKAGRKEKERGELQVTVQFTRNNMTASMFDLTMKDKPRSAFGKLKDRVTGRKRGDMESSSAIVPGRYAALSGSLGFGEEGGVVVEPPDVEIAEEKRSKMKDFFKGRLRKSSDTRSCSSLASESSVSSMASDNPGPPPSLDLLSDPPSSPIYTSKVRVDTHYGEADLAKKVLTSQHTTKILTHKRAFSDEASKITTAFPRSNPAVESLKGQTMTQSKSSLCINGSHVYDSEPSTPKSSGTHPSKLVLLEKCSPLSRSLQNLTKRGDDRGSFAEGRRWSFDKTKKEEKEEEKDSQASCSSAQQAQPGGQPVQAMMPGASPTGGSPDKGRKLRMTLFSGGRSDSLPAKSDLNQPAPSEGRLRGWFGSGDSQNKPRLEVSPKVESSSDVPPPLPPRSPVPPQCSSPSASPSPGDYNHTNPFTPSPSPSSTPISPSNPFPSQHNPFFAELIAEESQRSPPFAPCSPSGSSPFHYTTLPCTANPAHNVNAKNMASIKRDRPRPVARQISLPTILPKAATPNSPNHSAPCSMSGSATDWEDSFDAFASSRLNSPKGNLPQRQVRTSPTSSQRYSYLPVNTNNHAQGLQTCEEEPPPLPPRRLARTPVNEIYSDGWLHRGQELAVHKEAYLLSQTGVASLQRGREGESKRNSISPDPHTSSETSDSLSVNSQPYTNIISPVFMSEEKLKKFKYEPLEDDTDCWGGMLFEQDLYGRMCRGNYGQARVNSHRLSLNAEETSENKSAGPAMNLAREIYLADLLELSSSTSSKQDAKVLDMTDAEETSRNEITSMNSGPQMVLDKEKSVGDLLNLSSTTSSKQDEEVLDMMDAGETSRDKIISVNSGNKMVLDNEISLRELLNFSCTTATTSYRPDTKVRDMLNAQETSGNKVTSVNLGPKIVLDSEVSAGDLWNSSSPNNTSFKPDAAVLEEEVESDPLETACINNNVSFSLTLGDLNMNVNNSDFSFIDSDGSPQSEIVDAHKAINSLPQQSEDAQIVTYHAETVTSPQDIFTLKDTYIPEMNSSFEVSATSNKLCKVSPICQDNCQDCRCELNKVTTHDNSRVNGREMASSSLENQTSNALELESRANITKSTDDNGNPKGKIGVPDQKEPFSGVVSARFRPKGVSRQNSGGSPNNQSKSGEREFEQLLSLVQNISGVREGPLSYQPTKSALSSLLAFNKHMESQGDSTNKEANPQLSPKDNTAALLAGNCVTGKSSVISFEDLHAKVAPNSRTPLKSKIGQSLQESAPSSPSIPDAQATLYLSPFCCPSIHPSSVGPSVGASSTLAVAPYTSSSSSFSTTSTTDQPLVDARHSLLPEETQPASNLPQQESRSHPVKPLTSSQSEKKESRSVLEKLKSTIHPGRTTHQVAAEPERSQEATVDRSAQYQHLTNMELISLLLQQEMDMQKQQAAAEQQEAQLHKCEAELRKVKLQVRDLEDYIDNLLLRIMEQTPTLLQVRSRHK